MKEINELLELTGKAYLKKFIIALILMIVFVFLDVYGFNKIVSNVYLGKYIEVRPILDIPILTILYIIIILWMHERRFKKVLHEGSFQRIRILPIKKMSFVYSEILYVGAIYTMLFVGVGIAWVLGTMMSNECTLTELFYQINVNDLTRYYFPFTFLNLMKVVSLLASLTCATVYVCMASSDTDQKITARIVIILFIIISYMLNTFANAQGLGTSQQISYNTLSLIYICEMLCIVFFSFYKLRQYFGRKGKRS